MDCLRFLRLIYSRMMYHHVGTSRTKEFIAPPVFESLVDLRTMGLQLIKLIERTTIDAFGAPVYFRFWRPFRYLFRREISNKLEAFLRSLGRLKPELLLVYD